MMLRSIVLLLRWVRFKHKSGDLPALRLGRRGALRLPCGIGWQFTGGKSGWSGPVLSTLEAAGCFKDGALSSQRGAG